MRRRQKEAQGTPRTSATLTGLFTRLRLSGRRSAPPPVTLRFLGAYRDPKLLSGRSVLISLKKKLNMAD